MVDGGPWDNATINNLLHMIAPNSSDEVLIKASYMPYPTSSGILTISRGVMADKDFSSLGNLSTESPTILHFSSTGYTFCVNSDIGKPVKVNGVALQQTVLFDYDNNARKWWLSRPYDNISNGSTLTIGGSPAGTGAGTVDQTVMNTGGGAVMIGRSYEQYSDPARICLTNGDTLYITAGSSLPSGIDAVLADLKLKNLTANGSSAIGTSIVSGKKLVVNGVSRFNDTMFWGNSDQWGAASWDAGWFGFQARSGLSLKLCANGSWSTGATIDTLGNLSVSGLTLSSLTSMAGQNSGVARIGRFDGGIGSLRIQLGNYGTNTIFDILDNAWTVELFLVRNDKSVCTNHNTLDDGLGNMSLTGNLNVGAELCINHDIKPISGTTMSLLVNCGQSTNNVAYVEGHINPNHSNYYGIGGGSNYWSGVCANYFYGKHTTIQPFDSIDDLGLVKNYKVKKIIEKDIEKETIDFDSLPHLKSDDQDKQEFYDNGKCIGFLLGCVKALVQRLEILEKQVKQSQSAT